jgi:hypothetical protein
MVIYLVIFTLLVLISAFSIKGKVSKTINYYIVIVLCLFAALRYKIGMDYESYEELFNSAGNIPLTINQALDMFIEPGYIIIISYIKYFGINNLGVFAIHAILSIYFLNKAILKYSNNIYISWLIIFGVYFVNLYFNGLRQGLFIAILFYYLPIFLARKGFKNFAHLLLLSLFLFFALHKTAILFPVIYIISLFNPLIKTKIYIFFAFLIWAFSGVGEILISGIPYIKDIAYLGIIDFYTNHENFSASVNLLSITVLHRLVILIAALYLSEFKGAGLLFKKLINIYFWGIIIYLFCIPLGYMLATRINMNFKIFDVILISYFVLFFKTKTDKLLFLSIIIIWSLFSMLTNFYMPGNYDYYLPYRTILELK